MRFEVPQFIEIEDKIFGPFTWRQFIFLGGGVGFALVLFLTAPFFVFLFVGFPLGALGVLLAFYQINNRPFAVFLESIFNYFRKGRLYLWRKTNTGIYHGQPAIDDAEATLTNYSPGKGHGSLHSLSRNLELKAIQKPDQP